MRPTEHDPDIAQARVFRDLLDDEIAALTARIESARGHAGHARDRELGAGLRGQLAEAHQLVAGLIARYPELRGTRRTSGQ
ncbi:hypothetical protein [Rhodococcus jostii]|uniref:hypothetical protein n=1 Tax=Rhodococcus jostii TaxID=132919 RepID=UPI003632A56A